MDKNDILIILEQIEQKYSSVPEEQREYGSELSPEESKTYNYETHPGISREIQSKVLSNIKNNPNLMNDLDIGMKIVKLAPYAFRYIGEEARGNVDIFMEACKGNIGNSFDAAGDNILENEECMIMAMKIDPSLYRYIKDDMKARPEILKTYVEKAGYISEMVADEITPELRKQLTPYITYKIEGMRKETYMEEICEGHNCNFNYDTTELPKDVICCSRGDEKFEIELYVTSGECSSGWTTADWGNIDIHKVDEFGKMTHLPKEQTTFELELGKYGFDCPAFYVDFIGGDRYYPSGDAGANMDYFIEREQVQQIDKREQFDKEMESKTPRNDGFEVNEFGEIIRTTKSIEEMSVEELAEVESEYDKIIADNDEEIKQAYIERVLKKQQIIEGQRKVIKELKAQSIGNIDD